MHWLITALLSLHWSISSKNYPGQVHWICTTSTPHPGERSKCGPGHHRTRGSGFLSFPRKLRGEFFTCTRSFEKPPSQNGAHHWIDWRLLESIQNMDEDQCAKNCDEQIQCKSFEYDPGSKKCRMFKNHASKPNSTPPTTVPTVHLQYRFCQKEGKKTFYT